MAAMSILVVDDDRDTCASLSDLGYAVETANDGPAALEFSQRNSANLLRSHRRMALRFR